MALEKRVEVLFEQEKFSYLERKAKKGEDLRGQSSYGRRWMTVYLTEKEVDKRRECTKAHLLKSEPVDFGLGWAETSWEEIQGGNSSRERYRGTIGGKYMALKKAG